MRDRRRPVVRHGSLFIRSLIDLGPAAVANPSAVRSPDDEGIIGDHAPARPSGGAADLQQGLNTYVAKLGGGSCRKLITAAGVHLSLCDGAEVFRKDALLTRAREAREWKKDYAKEQASGISRMVRAGELIERPNGEYSVPQRVLDEAERLLKDA